MGRQKTLWIDEATWAKLEQMEGDSVSGKVRKAVQQYDQHSEKMIEALYLQVKALKTALREAGVDGWWMD